MRYIFLSHIALHGSILRNWQMKDVRAVKLRKMNNENFAKKKDIWRHTDVTAFK